MVCHVCEKACLNRIKIDFEPSLELRVGRFRRLEGRYELHTCGTEKALTRRSFQISSKAFIPLEIGQRVARDVCSKRS